MFVSKNWHNDLKVGCTSLYSLVEFIENNVDLEKEFEKFEGTFERDEVVKIKVFWG
jgi:hypothetical protein